MNTNNIGAEWGRMSNTRATRMPLKQIRLDADVVRLAEAHKPHLLETSQFIGLLVQKVLTGVDPLDTLGARPATGAGYLYKDLNKEEEERAREEEINVPPTPAPKKPKDPWSVKKVSPALVPEDIDGNHAELFVEWWSVRAKGAVRSEKVAYREFDKLRAWSIKDRTDALQKAISGGWKQLYMPEVFRKPNTPHEPETRHPAYRDAREIIREQEAQFNNIPSATGGRGVLEPGAF